MLGEKVVEHLGNEPLFSLGKLGDGIDLLLEARGTAALAWSACERFADQQFVEGQVEQFGQDRQHGCADTDTPDLLVREGLLGHPAFLARSGDARSGFLEESFIPDGHACDDPSNRRLGSGASSPRHVYPIARSSD